MTDERETSEQKSSFKLIRGQRGNFGYEIKILENDLELMKTKVKNMAQWAEDNYGQEKV